jgi:hypothetical protein
MTGKGWQAVYPPGSLLAHLGSDAHPLGSGGAARGALSQMLFQRGVIVCRKLPGGIKWELV